MKSPASLSSDVAHELTSTLSALLLGLQRLRRLTGEADRERALAIIDRLEDTVQGMAELVVSTRETPEVSSPSGAGSDS